MHWFQASHDKYRRNKLYFEDKDGGGEELAPSTVPEKPIRVLFWRELKYPSWHVPEATQRQFDLMMGCQWHASVSNPVLWPATHQLILRSVDFVPFAKRRGFGLMVSSSECKDPQSGRLGWFHYLRNRLPVDMAGRCASIHHASVSHGWRFGTIEDGKQENKKTQLEESQQQSPCAVVLYKRLHTHARTTSLFGM